MPRRRKQRFVSSHLCVRLPVGTDRQSVPRMVLPFVNTYLDLLRQQPKRSFWLPFLVKRYKETMVSYSDKWWCWRSAIHTSENVCILDISNVERRWKLCALLSLPEAESCVALRNLTEVGNLAQVSAQPCVHCACPRYFTQRKAFFLCLLEVGSLWGIQSGLLNLIDQGEQSVWLCEVIQKVGDYLKDTEIPGLS